MKTALITPCYLDDENKWTNNRLMRNVKWLDFHKKLFNKMNVDNVYFCDNASSFEKKRFLKGHESVFLIEYDQHLPRTGHLGYPYLWRVLYETKNLMSNYDKIVFLDTDIYLLSDVMVDWYANTNTGWQTLWCEKHGFPESGTWILSKDHYDKFNLFASGDYMKYNGKCMETFLPFTHVNKQFNGDRWGEGNNECPEDADFYAQAHNTRQFMFKGST